MKLLLLALILLGLSSCGESVSDEDDFQFQTPWVFFTITHPSGGIINCVGANPKNSGQMISCDWAGVK
jgi:hypothetical protein